MPENQASQLLDQLPPLHLPEPISFWPPAVGWWLLLFLLLVLLSFFVHYAIKYKRRNRLRKAALRQLDKIWQCYRKDGRADNYLVAVNRLLKQFVMQQYPDKSLHTLSGRVWLNGLQELSPRSNMSADSASVLLTVYARHADYSEQDVQALQPLLRQWFKALRLAS